MTQASERSPSDLARRMAKVGRRGGLALALAGAAAAGAHAAGRAEVSFVNAERFSDIGLTAADREAATRAIARRFEQRARELPDGQLLKVEVLDVDLAGEIVRGQANRRVVRGQADWPRMNFRFTLDEAGRPLTSGEARLSDMNFMRGMRRPGDDEPFAHDLRLIDDWFESAIAQPARR